MELCRNQIPSRIGLFQITLTPEVYTFDNRARRQKSRGAERSFQHCRISKNLVWTAAAF